MNALLLAAFILVTPPDWTASATDPAVTDAFVYWWAEDEFGQYLWIPASSSPIDGKLNKRHALDLWPVEPGTFVCVRAWSASNARAMYAAAVGVCAPAPDGFVPPWIEGP